MICPHCNADLKQTERTGHTCGKCRRRFAMDPKDNDLQLHDLRFRKLTAQLGDDGRLRYTREQLYYAAAAKAARAKGSSGAIGGCITAGFVGSLFVAIAACGDVPFFYLPAAVVWTFAGVTAWRLWTGRVPRRVAVGTPVGRFTEQVEAWARIHGGWPPGLVRGPGQALAPAAPRMAVLSPDPAVLTCLAANDIPRRLEVALAATVAEVPPGVPVLLLHDASVPGYRFAAYARATLAGRRILDASPRPEVLRAHAKALRLRGAWPPAAELRELRAAGQLSEADLKWLAKGWWSPVAAVRPASLISRVETAVVRLADPETRAAATVGFLTWPAP